MPQSSFSTSELYRGSTLSFTSFRDNGEEDYYNIGGSTNGKNNGSSSSSSGGSPKIMMKSTSDSSKRVLQIIKDAYLASDTSNQGQLLDWRTVLEIIINEYSYRAVPFTIEGTSYNPNSNEDDDDAEGIELFSKLLSYAAINRIPKELTSFLLSVCSAESLIPRDCAEGFQLYGGWSSVRFPSGLSLRVKRRYLVSKRQRFSPVPRRLMNQWQVFEAERLILEASRAKAPVKPISRADLLASMDVEPSVRSLFSSMTAESERWKESLKKDFEVYFPRQNRALQKFTKFLSAKSEAFKNVGRAGLISYGFLNFIWYTFAVLFSWRRAAAIPYAPAPIAAAQNSLLALRYSMQKFFRVLVSVYFGSQLTKLARLSLAVALAPVGDKVLWFAEERLNLGRDRAFNVVAVALFATCFLVWGFVVVGDAAISSAGTFTM